MEVIRTPVGKKIKYRYSYTLHGSGHSYSFDETNRLPLTVNGPVRFAVDRDKLRVIDETFRVRVVSSGGEEFVNALEGRMALCSTVIQN